MKRYTIIEFFSDINRVDGKEIRYTDDISEFMETIPIFDICKNDVIIIDNLEKKCIDNMNRTWEIIECYDEVN